MGFGTINAVIKMKGLTLGDSWEYSALT